MNQEKVVFDNLLSRYCTGAYAHYIKHDQSVGCIAHFLYVYGLINYDSVQIGNKTVTLHGKKIAEFTFDDDKLPVFTVLDEKLEHVKTSQEAFVKGLENKWHFENYLYNSYIKGSYKDKKWFN